MKKLIKLSVLPLLAITLMGCQSNNNTNSNSSTTTTTAQKEDAFKLWSKKASGADCEAIQELKSYVEEVTDETSDSFIPKEDRIATFDMDGTIIGELYPSYFEYNLLEYRVLDDPSYKDKASEQEIDAATKIREFVRNGVALPDHFDMIHAYAAAKAYSGMTLKEFDDYVKAYAAKPANGFSGMTYGESFYKPMLEIFDYLEEYDFNYYIVSGSDRFICRALVDSINIDPSKVIGMDVVLKSNNQGDEDGVNYTYKVEDTLIRTDELIIKNLKTNKVKQITQEIGKKPVLSFGNSGGDSAMHNYCLSNDYESKAFMLIADDEEDDHANREKALKLKEQWEDAGYIVISMRDDFTTIYGDGVLKTDFIFE